MNEDYFAGLDADLDAPGQTKSYVETFVHHQCEHCGGSGKWQNTDRKCFACKGNGGFKTSAHARSKARKSSAASKGKQLENAMAGFNEAHAGLIEELTGMTSWNSFALSLVDQFNRRGELSEKQVGAADRMIAKTHATRAARQVERDEASVTVDLSAIVAMFTNAKEHGLKRPTYRALGLKISLAPAHGVNAGALYIKRSGDTGTWTSSADHCWQENKSEDEYAGKIVEGVYKASGQHGVEVAEKLLIIAANPKEVASEHGKLTGSCSCCGRTLTDPVSVEAGIGPICAGNYGF